MITDDEIVKKFDELTKRVTNIDHDAVELARWAYEIGYDQAVKEDNMANWIKPKFKVGDKVRAGSVGSNTITSVQVRYAINNSLTHAWADDELTEYKENPLKVGDVVCNKERGKNPRTILAISGQDVLVRYHNRDGATGADKLDDLERV